MIHSLSFYTYVTFRQQIYIIPNGFLIVKKKWFYNGWPDILIVSYSYQ